METLNTASTFDIKVVVNNFVFSSEESYKNAKTVTTVQPRDSLNQVVTKDRFPKGLRGGDICKVIDCCLCWLVLSYLSTFIHIVLCICSCRATDDACVIYECCRHCGSCCCESSTTKNPTEPPMEQL